MNEYDDQSAETPQVPAKDPIAQDLAAQDDHSEDKAYDEEQYEDDVVQLKSELSLP